MSKNFQIILLDNNSKEENDTTKMSNSSKNQSKNSNGFTIITKAQRDIYHLANKNDKEIKQYIDSLCFDMFSSWEPKLLMDAFILTEHWQIYYIINHVNEDCVHTKYFDHQKYLVCNEFKGEGYSLLCKDLATSAINHGYQIVINGVSCWRFNR